MKSTVYWALIGLILLTQASILAAAGTPEAGDCQAHAEAKAKGFLELVLRSEWGWPEVKFVDSQVSLSSIPVGINKRYNSQKHEDYVFEFKVASREGATRGNGGRFEIQIFANQLDEGDAFRCYTNSFRLVWLKESIKL